MANDFDIHKLKDGSVLVVLHPACTIAKRAILALLEELDIDQTAVIFVLPEQVAEYCAEIGDIPVLIPIDRACSDATELNSAGRQCAQVGGRVIVLMGDDFTYEGLHPVAEKYGNQCGWSASQLEICFKNPALASPRDSGGTVIPRPMSRQVKC